MAQTVTTSIRLLVLAEEAKLQSRLASEKDNEDSAAWEANLDLDWGAPMLSDIQLPVLP
jgi:hypothetical protein